MTYSFPLTIVAIASVSLGAQQPARPAGARPQPVTATPRPDSAAQQDTAGRGGATMYNGLRFRSIGPALTSGRISDLAVHPTDPKIRYVAVASGGVFKTTNGGTTWTPIFDGEASYSVANIVIDPTNPNIVWVGTGENNAQRSVAYGDGVYKSVDGGRTWSNVGLKQSEHIGKILVHPTNSDIVFVAAQGPLSVKGGERGLYKTEDGGKTWRKVLDGGTWAGASDIVMDPRNPKVLLATTWQRYRRTYGYIAGGPESALWRSTDGGETWRKSQAGLPTQEDMGRIGLAISPKNPDVLYAIVEAANNRGGFFRSRDNGVNWERMSAHNTIGLYYSEIFADPHDVDRVYSMDVFNMVTDDGGRTFRRLGERNKHVDNHALWIDPEDPDHLLNGNDGGLYESFDRGEHWTFFGNLPITQFYRIELDNSMPFYRVYGGTQDNFSLGGPSRTRSESGILNSDWFVTAGGDGFQTRVDPKDPNTVYSESQHGNLQRFNLETGESINIVPQPELTDDPNRWYWDSPFIISPHNNTRLYFGSQRLYRSDDRGNSWRAVSPDLSRRIDRNRIRLMDRVWPVDAVAKNASSSFFGSLVALAESPLREGLLWIGTDDGDIHVSENGGESWRRITGFAGVPDTTQVARVTPSSHDVNTVYAAFDNHMSGDYKPYLLKSTNLGRTWSSIAGNLPERGTVYVVIDDPKDPNLLYVGTEFGVYFSRDGGGRWTRLRGGLPTIQVRDMAIHARDDDLVIATFGRGFYVLDDLAPLRSLTPQTLASNAALLPIGRTPLFVESSPLGGRGAGFQGSGMYVAQNPPFGATFTYYLRDAIRSRRERRQAAERAASRRNEDVFYPSWDTLRVEDREEAPAVLLTVTDPDGRTIRRLAGPMTAGVHRVTWDLRYPPATPNTGSAPPATDADDFARPPAGPYVLPGTYTVSLARRVDGVVTPLGSPQRFEVYMLDADATPRTPAVLAFQQQTSKLQRAVLGANALTTETLSRVQALRRALQETPAADDRLANDARGLETRLREIQMSLSGDPTIGRRQEPSAPSLINRLNGITNNLWSNSLDAPTATQRKQYEIVAVEFEKVLARLKPLVQTDLKRVEEAAEAAGAPWTSGRVPEWKP
jgi:photosystem II stability/assembly factor-like uncharacterized protein